MDCGKCHCNSDIKICNVEKQKEYTFEEVITNIKQGETYKCTHDIYAIKTVTKDKNGLIFNNNEPPKNCCGSNNIQRFVKLEKPVSFIEVLNSDKRCRVYYEKYNIINTSKYDTLDNTLRLISNFRKECDFKELFLFGEWYIED